MNVMLDVQGFQISDHWPCLSTKWVILSFRHGIWEACLGQAVPSVKTAGDDKKYRTFLKDKSPVAQRLHVGNNIYPHFPLNVPIFHLM